MSNSSATLASSSDDRRFSPITNLDHAGILWIATLLSGVYSLLAIFVRFYIKKATLGADDWSCTAATVLALASFFAIIVGLVQGLGRSASLLSAAQLRVIGKSAFTGQLCLILALCLSKCSVIFLIRRLFSQDMICHRVTCSICLLAVVIWGIMSVFGVSLYCEGDHLLLPHDGLCASQFLRWQLIGISDAILELSIFILSTALVWRLQMGLNLKLRVVLAFFFRLPLIPVVALGLYYLKRASIPMSDFSLLYTSTLVCQQIQLGYALLSATIPNLKSFIMSFDTSLMMDISHKLEQWPPRSYSDASTTYPPTTSSTSKPGDSIHSNSVHALCLSSVDPRHKFIGCLQPEQLENVTRIGYFRN